MGSRLASKWVCPPNILANGIGRRKFTPEERTAEQEKDRAENERREASKQRRDTEKAKQRQWMVNAEWIDESREFTPLASPESEWVKSLTMDEAIHWCESNASNVYKIKVKRQPEGFRVAVESLYLERTWLFHGRDLIAAVNKHIRNLSWLHPESQKLALVNPKTSQVVLVKDRFLNYLRSPEWKAKRAEALRLADYRCRVCYSPHQLEVHHRTYRNFGNEPQNDLTVLCDPCHDLFHGRMVLYKG